jgi:hypothetical protein
MHYRSHRRDWRCTIKTGRLAGKPAPATPPCFFPFFPPTGVPPPPPPPRHTAFFHWLISFRSKNRSEWMLRQWCFPEHVEMKGYFLVSSFFLLFFLFMQLFSYVFFRFFFIPVYSCYFSHSLPFDFLSSSQSFLSSVKFPPFCFSAKDVEARSNYTYNCSCRIQRAEGPQPVQ